MVGIFYGSLEKEKKKKKRVEKRKKEWTVDDSWFFRDRAEQHHSHVSGSPVKLNNLSLLS